ncbi:MAG: hypothetical protein AAFU77_09430 [Myxococcota bacterium]
MAQRPSGWVAVALTLLSFLAGVALCHLALYPTFIVDVPHPSLYRWFAVASPVLLGALCAGAAIHSVNDWLASSLAVALALQLYEFVAARAEIKPFVDSLAVVDPAAYWGAHFVGRAASVAFLLGVAAGAVEGARVYWAAKNDETKSP